MSDLPAPLVSGNPDLRGMTFIPLDVDRLLSSDLYAISTAEEFKAAITLWCRAWHQVPAGSLPSDDRILAHLSGAGTRWKRVREVAMHGFILCSDGRFYHPVICEKVRSVWEQRASFRARTEAARAARAQRRGPVTEGGEHDTTDTVTASATVSVTDPLTTVKGEGDKVSKKDQSSLRSDCAPAAPAALRQAELPAIPPGPQDARDELWREGIPILRRLSGKSEAQTRTLLGKLLRDAGDDCARVLAAIREAHDLRPADPLAWLNRAVQPTRPFRNGFLEMGRLEAEAQSSPGWVEGEAEEVHP